MLEGKCVVLGVTGGIAAYKACEIVSRLKKLGAAVRVVMTEHACQFVAPLTFETLSGNQVYVSSFEHSFEIEHISLAKSADLFLIAPATANIIGKIANGIADDLLSAVTMAAANQAYVFIAPAMNTNMYENPIVQENLEKLRGLGYQIIEPKEAMLACGTMGKGALADVEEIVRIVETVGGIESI